MCNKDKERNIQNLPLFNMEKQLLFRSTTFYFKIVL